jgi:hypothetical protein
MASTGGLRFQRIRHQVSRPVRVGHSNIALVTAIVHMVQAQCGGHVLVVCITPLHEVIRVWPEQQVTARLRITFCLWRVEYSTHTTCQVSSSHQVFDCHPWLLWTLCD